MASLIDKLTNVLMPEEEVEEAVKSNEAWAAKEGVEKRAVNGFERPVLTVHTNKVPELKVLVYVPKSFDQANAIADALKRKESVIVNYEDVEEKEQRRLCDFINGVCYILDGGVQRISDRMVLYVPENVEISKELCSFSMPTYIKQHSF